MLQGRAVPARYTIKPSRTAMLHAVPDYPGPSRLSWLVAGTALLSVSMVSPAQGRSMVNGCPNATFSSPAAVDEAQARGGACVPNFRFVGSFIKITYP